MGEAEWEDLRRRFRLWHSPIGELLEHTDSGREGVLLDYAYASPRVDTGSVLYAVQSYAISVLQTVPCEMTMVFLFVLLETLATR